MLNGKDQYSLYDAVYPSHEAGCELDPFQKSIAAGEGNRIVLQPRRTGSSLVQAVIASKKARQGDKVLLASRDERHVLPHLMTELSGETLRYQDGPLDISLLEGGRIRHVQAPAPGETDTEKVNAGRGQTFDLMILDQPQMASLEWFAHILGPASLTMPDAEFLLMATGGNYRTEEETALDDALKTGLFDVIWGGMVSMTDEGDTWAFPPGNALEQMAPTRALEQRDDLLFG
jgi:hypothetical protein